MKFIRYRNVLYFMFFLNYMLVFSHFGANAQEWCWTKSMVNDPSYVFNPNTGGINWGYCKKGVSSIKQIKYKISLLTSNLPNSGTDSTVNIQIFGSKGMTNLKALSSMVETGSHKDFEIEDRDIGNINKISLKIEGNKGYRCKSIKVVSDTNSSNFNCLERIEPCKNRVNNFSCIVELLPEGDSAYEITLKSSNGMEESLKSPILLALIGDKGISNFQMLSESGIQIGSTVENTIKFKDFGKISGYKIKISEKGKFKGSHLIVKTIRTGAVDQFDLKDVFLENPGNNFFSFDSAAGKIIDLQDKEALDKPKSESGFNKLFDEAENLFEKDNNTKNNEEEDDDDGLTTFTPSNSDASQQQPSGLDNSANGEFNVHNPDGGLMDEKEKREIINLDCQQTLSNPDSSSNLFGPNYPTSNINYMNILARCPSNCHKIQGTVYGKGIHPDISPICLSALIDRAISDYGGIISISIFPGLEKYVILENNNNNKNKDPLNDKIKTISYFGKPKKSYSLAKVDNVDLSERDIRILNVEGKYTNEGRVEIRINGKWGTICNKSNNALSAQRICRDLGYTFGFWANPEEKAGFCSSYKGKDYCGSSNSLSLFNAISCEIADESFNSCLKKYANPSECSAENNAIIICSSKNYSAGQNSKPDGVLKLAKLVKNESNHVGRLEIYVKDDFKTVCKNGFSNEAATVACRQMGYTGGDIINPDPSLLLTKAVEDSSPFGASEVHCSGSEKSLLDCKLNLNSENIKCTHDLDVVLKCDGLMGDPSGNSQLKSLEVKEAPPALGRLAAVKIKANCAMTGRDQKFRGDPGSVYLVSCPANCKTEKGNVWGVGIYTLDSSICQAAIHAGVIGNDKGGSFAFIKTWGQKYFASLERNGIYSSEFRDPFLVSFTVSSLNSQWKNMWKIWKLNSVGVYLEKNVQMGFLDKNKTLFSDSINKNRKLNKLKSSPITSSFLELQNQTKLRQTLPAAIFEWIQQNPSDIFSDKQNGSLLIQEHGMKQLSKFQIIIKASLIDFKNKKAFLFSYSGCKGFNVFLDANDSIVFGDVCNEENQINTGLQFPLNDKTIIWAFYSNAVLKVAVFSEKMQKPIAKVFNKILDINHASSVGIGKRADTNDEFFFGYIDFVLVYNDEVSFKEVSRVLNYVENKVKKTDSLELKETIDNRGCLSSCIKAPIPGVIGAPAPPKGADPYGSEMYFMPDSLLASRRGVGTKPSNVQRISNNGNIEKTENDETGLIQPSRSNGNNSSKSPIDFSARPGASIRGKNNKIKIGYRNPNNNQADSEYDSGSENSFSKNNNSDYNGSSDILNGNSQSSDYGTYEKSEENNIPSINLDCYSNLKDKRFAGSPGKIFRVQCPSCNLINRPVYGSFIYHPLSSICKAANHSGILNKQKSGYILVEILPGKQIYNGSVSTDGLVSGTFGAAEISFRTKSANPPKIISCSEAANSDQFSSGSLGSKFVVFCPENCSKAPTSTIFGSEVYADMSSICVSAVHTGAINNKGGEVEFIIEGPQSFFKGTNSNGIDSQSREAYNRAFRFIGNFKSSTAFFNYKEDFSGSLIDRWSINSDLKGFNSKLDSWSFKLMELNSSGEKKKLKVISHSGIIKSRLANDFGSILTLKDAEFSNGRIRTSLFFKDLSGLFSILFRYTDKSNYYAIEFEPKAPKNNLRLVSKKDGVYTILKSSTHEFQTQNFYRMQIILNNEDISVLLQQGDIREKKPVFTVKSDVLVRGTFGFAVNNNNALFVNGVQIDEFKNNQNKYSSEVNKRTFKDLLKNLLPKSRALFCQKNYESTNEIANCLVPLNFCRMKCEEETSEIENILLFKCLRDCTKSIQASGDAFKIQKKNWVPSINEKIDFKPKTEKEFVPAQMLSMKTKFKNGKNTNIYAVQFNDNKGTSYTENVEFPSPSIHKCGYMLERRKDCFKEDK